MPNLLECYAAFDFAQRCEIFAAVIELGGARVAGFGSRSSLLRTKPGTRKVVSGLNASFSLQVKCHSSPHSG